MARRVNTHGSRSSRPLARLTALGGRLAAYPGRFYLIGSRHAARLRGA